MGIELVATAVGVIGQVQLPNRVCRDTPNERIRPFAERALIVRNAKAHSVPQSAFASKTASTVCSRVEMDRALDARVDDFVDAKAL